MNLLKFYRLLRYGGGMTLPPTVSFQQIPIKLGSFFYGKVSDIVTVTIVMPACYERVKGL